LYLIQQRPKASLVFDTVGDTNLEGKDIFNSNDYIFITSRSSILHDHFLRKFSEAPDVLGSGGSDLLVNGCPHAALERDFTSFSIQRLPYFQLSVRPKVDLAMSLKGFSWIRRSGIGKNTHVWEGSGENGGTPFLFSLLEILLNMFLAVNLTSTLLIIGFFFWNYDGPLYIYIPPHSAMPTS
jgi:hypothetical protein